MKKNRDERIIVIDQETITTLLNTLHYSEIITSDGDRLITEDLKVIYKHIKKYNPHFRMEHEVVRPTLRELKLKTRKFLEENLGKKFVCSAYVWTQGRPVKLIYEVVGKHPTDNYTLVCKPISVFEKDIELSKKDKKRFRLFLSVGELKTQILRFPYIEPKQSAN